MTYDAFWSTLIYIAVGMIITAYGDHCARELNYTFRPLATFVGVTCWPILLALIVWYKVKEWMR